MGIENAYNFLLKKILLFLELSLLPPVLLSSRDHPNVFPEPFQQLSH